MTDRCLFPPGFAAGEAADEAHEERDDALYPSQKSVFAPICLFLRGIVGSRTLMIALMTVTIALTTAMKQEVMACTTELNCARSQWNAQSVGCGCLALAYAGSYGAHFRGTVSVLLLSGIAVVIRISAGTLCSLRC